MTYIFYATPNAPKSHTIQKIQTRMLTRIMHGNKIDKSELELY